MAAYAQPAPLGLELKLCIKFNAACRNIKRNFIIIENAHALLSADLLDPIPI